MAVFINAKIHCLVYEGQWIFLRVKTKLKKRAFMYVNILLVNTRWWEGRGKIDSRYIQVSRNVREIAVL